MFPLRCDTPTDMRTLAATTHQHGRNAINKQPIIQAKLVELCPPSPKLKISGPWFHRQVRSISPHLLVARCKKHVPWHAPSLPFTSQEEAPGAEQSMQGSGTYSEVAGASSGCRCGARSSPERLRNSCRCGQVAEEERCRREVAADRFQGLGRGGRDTLAGPKASPSRKGAGPHGGGDYGRICSPKLRTRRSPE